MRHDDYYPIPRPRGWLCPWLRISGKSGSPALLAASRISTTSGARPSPQTPDFGKSGARSHPRGPAVSLAPDSGKIRSNLLKPACQALLAASQISTTSRTQPSAQTPDFGKIRGLAVSLAPDSGNIRKSKHYWRPPGFLQHPGRGHHLKPRISGKSGARRHYAQKYKQIRAGKKT